MNDFLEDIGRYPLPIILTVFLHIVAFFYFNFKTFDQPFNMTDPEVNMVIPLDDINIDPAILDQLDYTQKEEQPEDVANISTDANDQRERSYEDFSSQEIDHQVEKDARELEKEFFEEWAATHGDNKTNSSNSNIEDPDDKNEHKNSVDKSNMDTQGANAYAGEVMVSYNLDGRKANSLPRPGYTCNGSGTVVVDIKVDKGGEVKVASFNSDLSRNVDECMINKAIRYAKESRFNYGSSLLQSGTITYKFVRG